MICHCFLCIFVMHFHFILYFYHFVDSHCHLILTYHQSSMMNHLILTKVVFLVLVWNHKKRMVLSNCWSQWPPWISTWPLGRSKCSQRMLWPYWWRQDEIPFAIRRTCIAGKIHQEMEKICFRCQYLNMINKNICKSNRISRLFPHRGVLTQILKPVATIPTRGHSYTSQTHYGTQTSM